MREAKRGNYSANFENGGGNGMGFDEKVRE